MTKEEAAEIILSEPVWRMCTECSGQSVIQIHDEIMGCTQCNGGGYGVTREMIEAHRVAGLELPPRPRNKVERAINDAIRTVTYATKRKIGETW